MSPRQPPAFPQRGLLRMELPLDRDARMKRLRFRAWHRGTREADLLIGGVFDVAEAGGDEAEPDWVDDRLGAEDDDIVGWAVGSAGPPGGFVGQVMCRVQAVNYVKYP